MSFLRFCCGLFALLTLLITSGLLLARQAHAQKTYLATAPDGTFIYRLDGRGERIWPHIVNYGEGVAASAQVWLKSGGEMYRLRRDGSQARTYAPLGPDHLLMLGAPIQGWLVYQNNVDGNLLFRHTDEQRLLPVYNRADEFLQLVTLAPDGTRFYYRRLNTRTLDMGYYMLEAATGQETRLDLPRGTLEFMSWTPNHEWLTFWMQTAGNQQDFFRLKADASELHPLFSTPYYTVIEAWLPDGQSFIASTEDGSHSDLFFIDFANAYYRLTDRFHNYRFVSLSPDSQRVLYLKRSRGTYSLYDLPTNPRADLTPRPLFVPPQGSIITGLNAQDGQIFFTLREGNLQTLYRLPYDGQNDYTAQALTLAGFEPLFAAYDPASATVLFNSGARNGLYQVGTDGRHLRKIADSTLFLSWLPPLEVPFRPLLPLVIGGLGAVGVAFFPKKGAKRHFQAPSPPPPRYAKLK